MEWLVLKNRRHEGPFTEPELREALQGGRVLVDDYVVSLSQAEAGDLSYVPLRKVLGLPDEPWESQRPAVTLPPAARPGSEKSPPPVSPQNQERAPLDAAMLARLESSDFVPGLAEPRKAPIETPVAAEPATPPPRRRRWLWVGGAVAVGSVAIVLYKPHLNKIYFSKSHARPVAAAARPARPAAPAAQGGLKPSAKDRPGSRRDLRLPELPPARDNRGPEPLIEPENVVGPEPASLLPPADTEAPVAEGVATFNANNGNNAPNAPNVGAAEAVQNPGAPAPLPAGFAPNGYPYDPQQLQLMQQMQQLQQPQSPNGVDPAPPVTRPDLVN